MNKFPIIILLSGLLLCLPACRPAESPKKTLITGEAQGTTYRVIYYATDTPVTKPVIDSLLDAFNLIASIWEENSIISRINNNDSAVEAGADFINIFKQSQRISEATNGAFDITVGPLVNAWGFGFRDRTEMDAHVVDSLLPLVGYRQVKLAGNKIVKDNPDIQIDYNAIAKGYSVDWLGGFLSANGIKNYLVEIGGEIVTRGSKPGGVPWVVGIEKPAPEADAPQVLEATVTLINRALATSGNYRKFYEKGGVRYSHTIDPATGYPVQHPLLSATVIADSAAIADGYATAFMVMGLEKARAFLSQHPELEAYFIYSDADGNYQTWATERLRNIINQQ
ncbi:MAG TPA: FAD:protein FMN transferase [Bacteroidales bacterium]|nr:FAD:protein FMN transferase [Bacteroidales bacterium]